MKNTPLHLITAFDAYDFDRNAYYALCYSIVPSHLRMDFYLDDNRENMHAILEPIHASPFMLKPIYKDWKLDKSKVADGRKDFPNLYLFQSETNPLLVLVELEGKVLSVDFLYSLEDREAEAWGLTILQDLRKQYGKEEKPSFKVLARDGAGGFCTTDVNTEDFSSVDIEATYNDDFGKINHIISEAIQEESSGLILLHGTPGTGKTSYIKHLISKHAKKDFIFLQNEFVHELLKPSFIAFLIRRKNSILIIEDAEKIIMPREVSGGNSVVSTILQLTDGLFSDYLNIKVICTFNSSLKKVDKALLRKGRLIANYEFQPLAQAKANALLAGIGGRATDSEMTLADIFNQEETGFEGDFVGEKVGF
jgi:hypothetical protein